MICFKCGDEIPEDSIICPICGIDILADSESENAVKDELSVVPHGKKIKRNIILISIGIILFICVIASIFVISKINGRANLKESLVGEWDYNSMFTVYVEDDTIEYYWNTGVDLLHGSFIEFEWEPVGKNKIRIKRLEDKDIVYTLYFSDEKDTVVISPSILFIEPSEIWTLSDN